MIYILRQRQWKLLDNFRRQFFLKTELKKKLLKSFIKTKYISYKYKVFLKLQLVKLKRNTSFTTHKNRCSVTGRVHNVLNKVQYSRFTFRKSANFGDLPGVSRLSR